MSDSIPIKTKGRGGGINTERGGRKRLQLTEDLGEDNKFYLYTYRVEQDTEDNEVVILDDIPIGDEDHIFDDVLIFDGIQIGASKYNVFTSDDDPDKGIYCPVVDFLRKNPDVTKKEKFIKNPQYGLVFTVIDRNEYQIKKGEREGEFVGDRRKLLVVTKSSIDATIRDFRKLCRKNNVDNLRGTVWLVSRGACDMKNRIYTPRIGDRWDFERVMSEEEMQEAFEDAAVEFGFDSVDDYLEPINYETVLEPLPVEDREKIANDIERMVGIGGDDKKRARGKRGGRGRSPRASRATGSRKSRRSRRSRDEESGGSSGSSDSNEEFFDDGEEDVPF